MAQADGEWHNTNRSEMVCREGREALGCLQMVTITGFCID